MSMRVAYIFRTDSDVDYLGLDSLAVHTTAWKPVRTYKLANNRYSCSLACYIPRKQALCSSLSKTQAIKTFRSDWSWDCSAAAHGLLWAAAALDLKFHFKGDGWSADYSQHPWSIYISATSGTFDSQLTAENNTFWAENENKTQIRSVSS